MRSSERTRYRGLFALDFDGTIRPSGGDIPPELCKKLELLGEEGVIRVIATGRSLYSLFGVISEDFPVEFIVFSSGAGVLRMSDMRVIMSRGFDSRETERIAEHLLSSSYDFMIHHPIPENHRFYYHHSGGENEDFFRRCELYRPHAQPFEQKRIEGMGASQFLIVDPEGEATAQRVKEDLGETVSVVRATSPIDHSTGWIEIFPPATDKGSGVDYLAKRFGLAAEECAAVGNDYNDLHMLEWVHWPYVVADAPDELRRRFRVVGPCAEGGAAEAVVFWLAGMEEKESGRRAKGAESREAAE